MGKSHLLTRGTRHRFLLREAREWSSQKILGREASSKMLPSLVCFSLKLLFPSNAFIKRIISPFLAVVKRGYKKYFKNSTFYTEIQHIVKKWRLFIPFWQEFGRCMCYNCIIRKQNYVLRSQKDEQV